MSAIRSESGQDKGGSLRESNNALAYARTQAPATVQCAWCGHRFDSTDDYLSRPGAVRPLRRGHDVALAK